MSPRPMKDEAVVSWEAKASFMRRVGATSAVWDDVGDLRELQLLDAPPPTRVHAVPSAPTPIRPVAVAQAAGPGAPAPSARPAGPAAQMAARLAQRHNIMFAASTTRPRLDVPAPPPPEASVPRAVRAKQEALKGGTTKRKR